MWDTKIDKEKLNGFARLIDGASGLNGCPTRISRDLIEPSVDHYVVLSRAMLDKITKVELLGTQGNVVRCTFSDGDVQKAVCSKEDKFYLEIGIAICISKHVFGGSSNYNRAIRQGLQVWKKQLKEEEEEIEKKNIAENHKRKRQRYLDRKKAKNEVRKLKEREQTIQDMAEAFKRAMGGTNG